MHYFVSGIRIALRGKAHAEWKAIVAGDQRNLEDDQYFIDERDIVFGKGELELLDIPSVFKYIFQKVDKGNE